MRPLRAIHVVLGVGVFLVAAPVFAKSQLNPNLLTNYAQIDEGIFGASDSDGFDTFEGAPSQEIAQSSGSLIVIDTEPVREFQDGGGTAYPESSDPTQPVQVAPSPLPQNLDGNSEPARAGLSQPDPNNPIYVNGIDMTTIVDNVDEELTYSAFIAIVSGRLPKTLGRLTMAVEVVDVGIVLGEASAVGSDLPKAGAEAPLARNVPHVITIPPPNMKRIEARREAIIAKQQAQANALAEAKAAQAQGAQGPALAAPAPGPNTIVERLPGDPAPGFGESRQAAQAAAVPAESPERKFFKKLRRYDRDENGYVSKREYEVYHMRGFVRYDIDSDGVITLPEIRFQRTKAEATKIARALLKRLDSNGDRRITRVEARTIIFRKFRSYDLNKDGVVEIGEAKS